MKTLMVVSALAATAGMGIAHDRLPLHHDSLYVRTQTSPQLPAATPEAVPARPPGQEEAPNETHVAPEAAATPHSPIPDRPADSTKVRTDEHAADRKLTAKIRKSLLADKSLSIYAHNVKIISQNGTVTLKGQVRSEDERSSVVAKAADATGSPDRVIDQMSVRP